MYTSGTWMGTASLPACSALARFRPTLSRHKGLNIYWTRSANASTAHFTLSTSEPGNTKILRSES